MFTSEEIAALEAITLDKSSWETVLSESELAALEDHLQERMRRLESSVFCPTMSGRDRAAPVTAWAKKIFTGVDALCKWLLEIGSCLLYNEKTMIKASTRAPRTHTHTLAHAFKRA